MASDDIAVPDFSYFIEHDLRHAIRQMDEAAGHETHQEPAVENISSGLKDVGSSASARPSATKKKKNKKAPDTTHVPKKFLSPYAVFADIRRQEVKAIYPDKKISDIWKELAIEWGHMTRIEKAPFRKEFENRQRLYELANPTSVNDRKGHKNSSSVFRFAPYRRNKEFDVSRIEHLPHCPIAAKRKVYEEAVLQPFTHPRQSGNVTKFSQDSTPERPAGCTTCPRVYAVCEYCRGLGYTGPRILHFECECWSKARHSKDRRNGFTYTSMPGRRAPSEPSVRHSHHLKKAASTLPKLPVRDDIMPVSKSSTDAVDLDKIFDCNLSQSESGFSNVTHPVPAAEEPVYDPQPAELPDLSVIDAFLASTGLKDCNSTPFW